MAILSSGGPQNFTLAVMTGDEKMLTAAQGIGKKIAQRIILELKDKIGGGAMELDFSGPTVSAPVQQGNNASLATAAGPAEKSSSAAPPILSFNSRIIRWAIFLPTP